MKWYDIEVTKPKPEVEVLTWHPELGIRAGHYLPRRDLLRSYGCMGWDTVRWWRHLPRVPRVLPEDAERRRPS